jgi:hypothetical protein
MKNLVKVLSAGVIATLLVPTLALAHENKGKDEVRFSTSIEKRLQKIEDGEHREVRIKANATTTAAAFTKKAVRIQTSADSMLSFNDRIGALIASSSAEGKAALEAKFAAFKTGAADAKVQAAAAISGAAQVNASNSTTTNAALLTAVKVDIKEANGFLHDAKKALMQILRLLWN